MQAWTVDFFIGRGHSSALYLSLRSQPDCLGQHAWSTLGLANGTPSGAGIRAMLANRGLYFPRLSAPRTSRLESIQPSTEKMKARS